MSKVCFYFELHQPYRLEDFSIFDLGSETSYFEVSGQERNRVIFQKVARKSYVPMLRLLLNLVRKHQDFYFSFSCSGVFLEQAQSYAPIVIELLQKLVSSGQVEVLSETYYHSLAALYSPEEFTKQVALHKQMVWDLFAVKPQVFRNTELIYSNDIAQQVADLGFTTMLTEAVERNLRGRSKTQVFQSASNPPLTLLLKHAELSDDIAFRFSDKSWVSFPLMSDQYLDWLNSYGETELINLFMDFETFGEHQWEDTGIFTFFEQFVERFLKQPYAEFVTPTQVHAATVSNLGWTAALPIYDVHSPISWADVDRDLTAWIDNELQQDTLRAIYELETTIAQRADPELTTIWRKLQTSDHFYYMCTKWSNDGDVHAYFSPYESPFEAYRRFSTVLADLQARILYT